MTTNVRLDLRENYAGTMNADSSCERYIIKRETPQRLERRSEEDHEGIAEKWIYIRVGGDKYRPVSFTLIILRQPDEANGSESEIGGNKSLIQLLKMLMQRPGEYKETWQQKPEHVVQAGLIHHALLHEMSLNGRLSGFSDFFDELIFVTDELKAGDIRPTSSPRWKRTQIFPV